MRCPPQSGIHMCLCTCACLPPPQCMLLWSLSKRPRGTDNIHCTIYHPHLSPLLLSHFYIISLSLPLLLIHNWIQVSRCDNGHFSPCWKRQWALRLNEESLLYHLNGEVWRTRWISYAYFLAHDDIFFTYLGILMSASVHTEIWRDYRCRCFCDLSFVELITIWLS